MDYTSRMVTLLGELRRQRNGAVADAMQVYGTQAGLNYGVSLATVRQMARALVPDHGFARYLYLQDVRELRLAALHLAQPERIAVPEFGTWAAGIVNSELAEEAAFALLWRVEDFGELFDTWALSDNPFMQYAALLAGARNAGLSAAWIDRALQVVRRSGGLLAAKGAVALLVACAGQNEENRQAVIRAVGSLGSLPAEDFVHEELAWRLEG